MAAVLLLQRFCIYILLTFRKTAIKHSQCAHPRNPKGSARRYRQGRLRLAGQPQRRAEFAMGPCPLSLTADVPLPHRTLPRADLSLVSALWQVEGLVGRFDHYCSWLGNAIGARNHLWFLVLVLLQALHLVLGLSLCASLRRTAASINPAAPSPRSLLLNMSNCHHLCTEVSVICLSVLRGFSTWQ